ncbi:hypothetical protein E4U56_003611 [Claviceps arundinis]|uniref:BTB domain-containing protein n=1 Tax=Claviceps arundinis TaxID=1623583 RepID=A0A9P7SN22_9HYPO|nr:hypothetical protein E4U56_003611 [Claviceps arundinis]
MTDIMNNTINMKASVYEEIITFKPFKFVVGKERKEVYMHSALVARWSRVLDKMMSSPFIEGQQGFAVLADEDVRTVAAFAEFVYTGDYHLPSVEAPLDSKTEHGGTESHDTNDCRDSDKVLGRPLNNHWTAFATSEEYGTYGCRKPSSNPVTPSTARFRLCPKCYWIFPYGGDCTSCGHKLDAPPAPAPPSVPLAPVLNPGSMRTDYSDFFIAHAKVFAFADCYGINALMDLSMRRLHQALCGFRLSKTRVGDILALVRFCYERPGPEKLKRLVASYSAAIMDPGVSNLMPDYFQQLLKERGDFAADMAWFLASRAAGSTKC